MQAIARAVTGTTLLLMACGWIHYFLRTPVRAPALGLLAGLGVAAGAIQMGVRMETRRITACGEGTPRSAMARRLTLFFSIMTLVVGGMRMGRVLATIPALAAMAAFSAVWIPAAIGWWRAPRAGPIAARPSVAARGSFFGMAVSALAAAASPWLLSSAAGTGFLAGLWISAGLLVAAAWLAVCVGKAV